jgi:hypothetical protein
MFFSEGNQTIQDFLKAISGEDYQIADLMLYLFSKDAGALNKYNLVPSSQKGVKEIRHVPDILMRERFSPRKATDRPNKSIKGLRGRNSENKRG